MSPESPETHEALCTQAVGAVLGDVHVVRDVLRLCAEAQRQGLTLEELVVFAGPRAALVQQGFSVCPCPMQAQAMPLRYVLDLMAGPAAQAPHVADLALRLRLPVGLGEVRVIVFHARGQSVAVVRPRWASPGAAEGRSHGRHDVH